MVFLRQVARFLLALSLCLDAQRVGRAGSVSLHPTADTTISQKTSVPTTELVIGTNGKSESSRALLKFDIAGNIPSNAIITSAALTVTVTKVPPGGGVSSLFDLRAVLFAWSPSGATWANRLAATPWSTLGGAVGVDFSNKISQTNFFGSATGLYTFISNSNLVADVQNWLQNASANFGWVVISEMQGVLHSERTLDASSPTLLVQFTVPATPPTITLSSVTNGIFRFYFNAESNRTYVVQYVDRLSNPNWSVLTNFSLSSIPTNFFVSDFLTTSNRFYRVQTP